MFEMGQKEAFFFFVALFLGITFLSGCSQGKDGVKKKKWCVWHVGDRQASLRLFKILFKSGEKNSRIV